MSGGLLGFIGVLAIGSAMILLNLGIQIWAVYRLVLYLEPRMGSEAAAGVARRGMKLLSITLGFLFVGHILQFATWGLLFVILGEFQSFASAFYHSTVNFTSLGYGDIVMSEKWRLLGALEAANGVLMFGLTAGLVLSVMTRLLSEHQELGASRAARQGTDVD